MKFKIWENELEFNINTKEIKYWDKVFKPSVRTFWDMKSLYKDWIDIDNDKWLYFMYRWVYMNSDDKKIFEENNCRYDITILLPEIIWDEFNKTYWHYHPLKNDWRKYEEIYQVLSWNAIYLQQNDNEVKFTNAFTWDKIVMNESFGHITINSSDENILIMSNIVDSTFESEYWEYKELKWWNYYYKLWWFEKNPNYKNNISISESEELFEWWDMYEDFLINPEIFNFLH